MEKPGVCDVDSQNKIETPDQTKQGDLLADQAALNRIHIEMEKYRLRLTLTDHED